MNDDPRHTDTDLRKSLTGYLTTLARAGLTAIPKPADLPQQQGDGRPEARPPQAPEPSLTGERAEETAASSTREAKQDYQATSPQNNLFSQKKTEQSMSAKKRRSNKECAVQLDIIRSEVEGCTLCRELAETRTQTVFGVGHPNPRLVIIGEAPGANEDKQGEPFVGRAGQLLDKILEACNMSRADVFILNTLKCRPPGNRNPSDDEIGNCWNFALRQLDVLQPEFICCLGGIAAKTVLDTKASIGKLRSQMHDFQGIPTMVTYHPAYLLRNPAAKKMVWEDMKMLMREMGTPVE